MLYCKGCECIIVPGRAFLTSGGYYCPHCMEAMRLESMGDLAEKTELLRYGNAENHNGLK